MVMVVMRVLRGDGDDESIARWVMHDNCFGWGGVGIEASDRAMPLAAIRSHATAFVLRPSSTYPLQPALVAGTGRCWIRQPPRASARRRASSAQTLRRRRHRQARLAREEPQLADGSSTPSRFVYPLTGRGARRREGCLVRSLQWGDGACVAVERRHALHARLRCRWVEGGGASKAARALRNRCGKRLPSDKCFAGVLRQPAHTKHSMSLCSRANPWNSEAHGASPDAVGVARLAEFLINYRDTMRTVYIQTTYTHPTYYYDLRTRTDVGVKIKKGLTKRLALVRRKPYGILRR